MRLVSTLIVFASDNGGPQPGKVTSNGPFRAGKGTLYEGGVRVCACAAYPKYIKPGTVVNEPLHMVDWYPTLLKLAGVSLRSVLKLLLEPAQLTYVVENEVMKITTSTKAGEKLSTRVYPVADLVIPIDDYIIPDSLNFQNSMKRITEQQGAHLNGGMPNGRFQLQNGQPTGPEGRQLDGDVAVPTPACRRRS